MVATLTTHVIVTTYNRPSQFRMLAEALRSPHLNIHAWNDGSDVRYPRTDWVEEHLEAHHGREAYGELVHRAFAHALTREWDRILMVPDDVTPNPGALSRLESIWRQIPDEYMLLLNPLVDRRGIVPQWGSVYPLKVGGAWITGWNDMCFYSDNRLRPHLRSRFEPPPEYIRGSGVGRQWSRRLREHGNLWQVDRSLFEHLPGPSVMCPREREVNPL